MQNENKYKMVLVNGLDHLNEYLLIAFVIYE